MSFSDFGTGYVLTEATRKMLEASQAKAQRENEWFDKNFPIVVSDAVEPDTILAVNWRGIIDGLRRGQSYEEACIGNCAKITGLL